MSTWISPGTGTLEEMLSMPLHETRALGSDGEWPDQIQRVPGGWIYWSMFYVRRNEDPTMQTAVFVPEPLLPIPPMIHMKVGGPEDDWRLYPDELPEEAGFYQCTFKLPSGQRFVREDAFDGGSFARGELVKAWRPLPEPYSPPEDEREKGNGEMCCRCESIILGRVYKVSRDGKEFLSYCGPCYPPAQEEPRP